MAKTLKCSKCGTVDKSKPGHVGTSVSMLCGDCGGRKDVTLGSGRVVPNAPQPATLCRNCCPTGHGTRAEV